MAFLHPALLATAGGLALLPLVIHLLSRRGYQSQPWAAMMFLKAAQEASRRRLRVERWLLLVVRTLIVVFLGVAIARPLASGSVLGDAIAKPRFDRVIIIDDSLSMQAVHPDGTTAFDAAKALARRLIEQCEARDGLALIAASTAPRSWMDQPMHDRQALRGILDGWKCSYTTGDVSGALRLAAELLSRGQAPPGCRLVYWIGDRTRVSFESTAQTTSNPSEGTHDWPGIDRIFVLDAGPVERDNVAVSSLSAASQIVGLGVPARFSVRIVNHGSVRVEQVNCELALDGTVVQSRVVGPLDPHGEASEDFELVFNSEGPHRVSAQIKGESSGVLSADDVRYLGVQVASGLSVLAVEGSDDSRKTARELFYYSVTVSSPTTKLEQTGLRIKTVTPLDLESEILGDYSVVVLGNVRKVSEEAWRRIDRFARAGGGLLTVLGDRIQADHYNEMAAKFAELLPFQLEEAQTAPESAEPWRMRIDEPRHLALADLVGSDRGGLGVAQVQAYWQIREKSGSSLRAPIRLSKGAPLLIQGDIGQGRILAWLTSANMAWNNLPAKPDYLPLMLNLTLYAAGSDRSPGDLLVMQPIVRHGGIDGGRPAGVVQRPDGESVKVEWTPSLDSSALAYGQTDRPGFYVVAAGHDRSIAAVNVDPRESDLTVAEEIAVQKSLGALAKIVSEPRDAVAEQTPKPPRELAPFFMVLLLVLVASETILATVFGGRA